MGLLCHIKYLGFAASAFMYLKPVEKAILSMNGLAHFCGLQSLSNNSESVIRY